MLKSSSEAHNDETHHPKSLIVPRESFIHAFGGQRNPIPLTCSNSIEGLRRSVTHLTAPKVSPSFGAVHKVCRQILGISRPPPPLSELAEDLYNKIHATSPTSYAFPCLRCVHTIWMPPKGRNAAESLYNRVISSSLPPGDRLQSKPLIGDVSIGDAANDDVNRENGKARRTGVIIICDLRETKDM